MIAASAIRSQWFGRARRPTNATAFSRDIVWVPWKLGGADSWESGDWEGASMGNHIRCGFGKRKMPARGAFHDEAHDRVATTPQAAHGEVV
jgi:hypothetical protein